MTHGSTLHDPPISRSQDQANNTDVSFEGKASSISGRAMVGTSSPARGSKVAKAGRLVAGANALRFK